MTFACHMISFHGHLSCSLQLAELVPHGKKLGHDLDPLLQISPSPLMIATDRFYSSPQLSETQYNPFGRITVDERKTTK